MSAALLLRLPALLPWGLAACLSSYAFGLLATAGALDPLAPAYAAGLLLAAELAYWSAEDRVGQETAEVVRRRLGALLVLAVATAAVGSVVLLAAETRPAGGPAVLGLGIAAAVAVAAVLAALAARAGGR